MTAAVRRGEPRGHDVVALGVEHRAVDGAARNLPIVRPKARRLRPAARHANSNRDVADLRRAAIAIHDGSARSRQRDVGAAAIAHEVVDNALLEHAAIGAEKCVPQARTGRLARRRLRRVAGFVAAIEPHGSRAIAVAKPADEPMLARRRIIIE